MSKKTYKELEAIAAEIKAEQQRVNLSINLGFCPECGEKLISEKKEVYDVPRKQFFGLFVEYHQYWYSRIICPNDKRHYEKKYNNDLGY